MNDPKNTETLFLLLFLPLFSVPIVFLRQVVGMKTFGVFIPIILAYSLLHIGLEVGLSSFLLLTFLGIITDRLLVGMNILPTARKSLGLFFLGFYALIIVVISIAYAIPVAYLGVPFIITVYMMDKFNTITDEEGFWSAFWMLAQTFGVAVLTYLLYMWIKPQVLDFQLLVNLFCISFCIDVALALYSGPRISEFIRFKKILAPLQIGAGFLGMNFRNAELIEKYNTVESKKIVDDKVLTKQILEPYDIPTTTMLGVIESTEESKINTILNELKPPFVLKPANGYAGKGIIIIESEENGIYTDIKNKEWKRTALVEIIQEMVKGTFSLNAEEESGDTAMIEEKLIPPVFFTDLAEKGLPDIRVIYFHDIAIGAMIRIPTEKSDGKANLSLGAFAGDIDLETGEIKGVYNKFGKSVDHISIGNIMPQWENLLEVGRKAVEASGLGYAGADIVYDQEKGPIIMELNARPGLMIQNITGINLRKKIDEIEKDML